MDPSSNTGGDFCRAMYRSKSRDCITLFFSQLLVCRMRIKPGFSHSSHHSERLFPSPGHDVKWLKQPVVQWEMVLVMLAVC